MSGVETRAAQAEWGRLVGLDYQAQEAAYKLAVSVTSIQDVRAVVLGESALPMNDLALFDQFDRPGDYYHFLARVGMDQERDPYANPTFVERIAGVIECLHVPGTWAWLETDVWEKFHKERVYAIGRIASARLAIARQRPTDTAEHEVVFKVETYTMASDNRPWSEVSVEDIARQFDPATMSGIDYPFIVVGRQAVRSMVEHLYFRNYDYIKQERRAGMLTAMIEGNLSILELGFDEMTVMGRREQIIEDLKGVCEEGADHEDGDELYQMEILMLAPLCEGNREALDIVNKVLGDKQPGEMGKHFEHDYALLVKCQDV